jgi:RNA polymerase sigma-70 factor (ECF subfamily)
VSHEPAAEHPADQPGIEPTVRLLDRYRAGDASARDQLIARYLPILRGWAHGRLPRTARDIQDTDDLVQNTMMSVMRQLARFEPEHEGAFIAYLRRALMNRVRDEIRRARRSPGVQEITERILDDTRSPLERAVGAELLERYEKALEQLPAATQEAIVMRVEMGYSYREVAAAVGSPSENAVRMTIVRGLARIVEQIDERRDAEPTD